MVRVYIGIGSNLGDKRKNIEKALNQLKKAEGFKVKRISSFYGTDPVGGPPQGKFLNGVIKAETKLSPYHLLKELKAVEKYLGRLKTVRNGPRIIDLDILLYGDKKIKTKRLTIPHPRMGSREFVLRPLKEIISRSELNLIKHETNI